MAWTDQWDATEYEVFLETWAPSERLLHASLPQHLGDPYGLARLAADSTGEADVERTPYAPGVKAMPAEERLARRYDYFVDHQQTWSNEFRDYLLSRDIPKKKVDAFLTGFAQAWVDGKARRQHSALMMGIKASIRDYDRLNSPSTCGRYVLHTVPDDVAPFFSPQEMRSVFEANEGLIDAFLPGYVDSLGADGPGSVGDIYVRRGVMMPSVGTIRKELYALSSYSLGIGAVEQFAQTWTQSTKAKGVPSIFSAPLPAVQTRIVAFAPFIAGMTLEQLELVVAPPVSETPLIEQGDFGGIREFLFE